jgi:hypothetical protein
VNPDTFTNGGAVAAMGSPWWLPSLQSVSDTAALMLPILGVLWLLVQIGLKVRSHIKKTKAD